MKDTSHSTCRVCSGRAASCFVATDRNRAISAERFPYSRCRDCESVQIDEIPADLGRYYGRGYHGLPAPERLGDHAVLESGKVAMVAEATAGRRLIEIGPSFGAFSYAARAAGFDVSAIEMDEECCGYLRSAVGLDVVVHSDDPISALGDLEDADAIVLWHVLEHVPDPVGLVRAAATHLTPGGVLAIAVPNPQSLQLRLLGTRWAHLDAPRHVTLPAHERLLAVAAAAGLEHVSTTTRDDFGRHCNRFGWEYALRRRPSDGPSGKPVVRGSQVLQKLLAPVEERGLRGAAYSVVLRRPA